MELRIEEGVLKTKKSCVLCAKVDVCKFYSKAEELFKSNMFYEMTEYLEWNNNLKAWSENSSCQFYQPYLYNEDLLNVELKKEKTFLNTISFWNIVKSYFKEVLSNKYVEYFDKEKLVYREKGGSYLEMEEDRLFNHLISVSSSKHVYTITANDRSWLEEINLIDVLRHYKAFDKLKNK